MFYATAAAPKPLTFATAPYLGRRRYGQSRSMLQACIAAGYSIAATQGHLNAQGKRALAGLPVYWPS